MYIDQWTNEKRMISTKKYLCECVKTDRENSIHKTLSNKQLLKTLTAMKFIWRSCLKLCNVLKRYCLVFGSRLGKSLNVTIEMYLKKFKSSINKMRDKIRTWVCFSLPNEKKRESPLQHILFSGLNLKKKIILPKL